MDEDKLINRKNKAIKEDNKALLISTCTDLAGLYVDKGRHEFAIEEYKEISNIHKRDNNQLDYGIANRAIGEAYLALRDFDKALHHQKIYLEKAKKMKSTLEEQRALATIGHLFLTKHLESGVEKEDPNVLNSAYKYFMKSYDICKSLTTEVSKLEKADMTARILSNLGLVQESLGNNKKAWDLISQSISLCKAHDIYEQLLRGYTSLASILEKRDSGKGALEYYNLAVETAEKIKSNPSLLAAALTTKAEALVKLGDLNGAKSTLHKAYKLKLPNKEEHATIEANFKVVIKMCRTERDLLSTDSTDYGRSKELYEKLGDGASELKLYKKAIDYYKKMLENAQKAGLTGPDLIACHYSLGDTLKDDGQYDQAVSHYETEMELRGDNLVENLNTLSKIADAKEGANRDAAEVVAVYQRALASCRRWGNAHEEGRMVGRCAAYLRRRGRNCDAAIWERRLDALDYVSSDGEGDEEAPTPSIGADVDSGDVSGLSGDEAEVERAGANRRTNRRPRSFGAIKKNVRGETQLHTACIHGKLNVVRHLLEQGHPVNVRDNSGWLPLHEACNWGKLEVVEALLEKGAAINDRGGTHCGGVTPLHDAASNGHLKILKYLLEKGANPLAKTDGGETVLSFLNTWYESHGSDLYGEDRELYEELSAKMSASLDKVGENSSHNQPESTQNSKKAASSSSLVSHLRRSSKVGLEDSASTMSPSSQASKSGADDYRTVMERLRRNNKNVNENTRRSFDNSPGSSNSKRPALVEADMDDDHWLEDDLPKHNTKSCKKRKTNSPVKHHPLALRRLSSNESSNDNFEVSSEKHGNEPQPIFDDPDFERNRVNILDIDSDSNDSFTSHTSKGSKKSHQRALTEAGFSRSTTPNFSQFSVTTPNLKKRKYQSKLTSFGRAQSFAEADSTCPPITRMSLSPQKSANMSITGSQFEAPVIDPMLSVDVRIDGKLFRVPVLMSQIGVLTIKWLAEEASTRYAKKEFIRPSLELETKSGAILGDDDPLTLLFPAGATEAEAVEGRITKWNVPPLIDRFKEACHDTKIDPDKKICEILIRVSTTLDFSNAGLSGAALSPLCRSLNKQTNLLELNLSGNFLTTECIKLLSSSLPSLENLYRLNLSCTGLITEHLEILSFAFVTNNTNNSNKLKCLDLSDNYLNDGSFEFLSILTNHTSLKELNLSMNEISLVPRGSTVNLKSLDNLDISGNLLKNSSVIEFVSGLDPGKLRFFNCSNNKTEPGLLGQIFSIFLEKSRDNIPLHNLNLSRCHVQDSELLNFSRLLDDIEVLDLSYNPELTGISLERLLSIKSLTQLNLCGCSSILKYQDAISDESIYSLEGQFKTHLKITIPIEENDEMYFRWKESLRWVKFDKILYFHTNFDRDMKT